MILALILFNNRIPQIPICYVLKKNLFFILNVESFIFSSAFELDEPMTQLFNGQSKTLNDNDQKVIFTYLLHT